MNIFTESEIEVFSVAELQAVGFEFIPGQSIAPQDKPAKFESVIEAKAPYGEPNRESYVDVILNHSFAAAVKRLNPAVPESARQQAIKTVLSVFSPQLIGANEVFHISHRRYSRRSAQTRPAARRTRLAGGFPEP
jgi:type I restriction enzyme R subunit